MRMDKLTTNFQEALADAQSLALGKDHAYIEPAHVVVAMLALGYLAVRLQRGAYGSHDSHAMETGAAFWHMVDLLWIVLFPLVYVLR